MKRLITASFFILLMLLSFTACAKVQSSDNLIANGNFNKYEDGKVVTYTQSENKVKWIKNPDDSTKYIAKPEDVYNKAVAPDYPNKKYKGMQRWADTLPSGWKVRTSDPVVASLAGYEYYNEKDINGISVKTVNAVTLIIDRYATKSGSATIGYGWIQIYQKVKVNPHANYKITYEYNGSMSRPDATLVKDAAGMGVGFWEDPSYIPPNALGTSNNYFSQDATNLVSFKTYTSPVFNTGGRRSLTVCITVGAKGHEAGDTRVNIRNIKMTEEIGADVKADHTIIKNSGYKDSNTLAIIITVAAFVILLALCWFMIHGVNKNYVYAKAKEDESVDIKALKATDTKAYKAKQPPKAKDTDKWKKK